MPKCGALTIFTTGAVKAKSNERMIKSFPLAYFATFSRHSANVQDWLNKSALIG